MTVAPVVDFRQGFRSATWAPLWEEFFCDWRQLWFNEHIEPPSWVLGDEAIAAGAKGILFPSTMAAPGVNLVLYVDRFDADDVIEVFDPSGALPKNQDSWR